MAVGEKELAVERIQFAMKKLLGRRNIDLTIIDPKMISTDAERR